MQLYQNPYNLAISSKLNKLYNINVMGSYYYVEDKDSDLALTPIPEDEYMRAILRIAKRQGVKIDDKVILKEVENIEKENLGKNKDNGTYD